MMDSTIPASRVISMALWGLVSALGITAWALGIAGDWNWAVLVGLTACATSAAAATANVRCYAIRLCGQIKAARFAPTVPAPRMAPSEEDGVHHLY